MGPQLLLAAVPTPKVVGSGVLAKTSEHALGYIWAEFGAFRLVCVKYPSLQGPATFYPDRRKGPLYPDWRKNCSPPQIVAL